MAQTKARTSVKDKALYKRLRNLGVSVKESTRVANAGAKTSRQKAGQRGGAATSYANWKVPELRRRARGWHQGPVNYEQKATHQGVAHFLERLPSRTRLTPAFLRCWSRPGGALAVVVANEIRA